MPILNTLVNKSTRQPVNLFAVSANVLRVCTTACAKMSTCVVRSHKKTLPLRLK